MTTYAFETITAAEALAFRSADNLTVAGGSAKTTTVLFLDGPTYSVMIGDRTVIFGEEFRFLAARINFPDGSQLFVGSTDADNRSFLDLISTGAMYGGDGRDTLAAGMGDWLIQGNQGDDLIRPRSLGVNTIYGGQGNDNIVMTGGGPAPDGRQFIQGNKGSDTIQGATAADTLLGGQGNDAIEGRGGQDFINGNLGDDELSGSGQLFGEGGNDELIGSGGATLFGGDGDDLIRIGGGSTDVVTHNVAHGDAGNDTFSALTFTSAEIHGDDGNDLIEIIQTSEGVNVGKLLDGGTGADTVRGSGGAETLLGGDGNDLLNGGKGADLMTGGAGADTFVLQDRPATNTLGDIDRILDWSAEDRIDVAGPVANYMEASAGDLASALQLAKTTLADGQADLVVVQISDGLVVFSTTFEAGAAGAVDTAALLVGRTLADISAANFV